MSPFYRHCLAEQRNAHLLGLSLSGLFWFFAPSELGARAWAAVAYSAVLGALVIGRSQRRREAGWLNQLLQQDSGRRLLGLDLLTDIAQCVVFAFCVSGFSMDGCGVIFAWALLLNAIAHWLDRSCRSMASAWAWFALIWFSLVVSPLPLGPYYNATEWSPAIATWMTALHPAPSLIAAWGLPHLQDPVLYKITLLGVRWVKPIDWWIGPGIYMGITVVLMCGSALLPMRIRLLRRKRPCV